VEEGDGENYLWFRANRNASSPQTLSDFVPNVEFVRRNRRMITVKPPVFQLVSEFFENGSWWKVAGNQSDAKKFCFHHHPTR
jgi:hypothetical protein